MWFTRWGRSVGDTGSPRSAAMAATGRASPSSGSGRATGGEPSMVAGQIERVAVVGAGIMGTGIAQVFAQVGFAVAQTDVSESVLVKSRERMRQSLEGLVAKGKLPREEAAAAVGRVRQTVVVEDAANEADFVVEAVIEDLEMKKKVFAEWDRICPPRAILATNTSILSPTEIASATR